MHGCDRRHCGESAPVLSGTLRVAVRLLPLLSDARAAAYLSAFAYQPEAERL